jgi:hypothetical protein
MITGEVDLKAPVNLADRHVLRLSIDGARPVDVDVAGQAADSTTLGEIVDRLNQLHPRLAAPVQEAGQDHLRLTSPTAGPESSLEILPLRALELIDYPPEAADETPHTVRHGDRWLTNNDGAGESDLTVSVSAPEGEVGPTILNLTTGRRVRVTSVLDGGETLELARGIGGDLQARICSPTGNVRTVPGADIVAGPPGAQLHVPFQGEWTLRGGDAVEPSSLQLNDPEAPAILMLRARTAGQTCGVRVVEARLNGRPPALPPADGRSVQLPGRLRSAGPGFEIPRGTVAVRLESDVDLDPYADRVVTATGVLQTRDGVPVLAVRTLTPIFDVTMRGHIDGKPVEEKYLRVTIGRGLESPQSLWRQIVAGAAPSRLVTARELDKGEGLVLPLGQSEWLYLSCQAARFDTASFDAGSFAGGVCVQRGVFNASRFASATPEPDAVFSEDPPLSDPTVDVLFSWSRFQPGAFTVNLPADLPAAYGGQFDTARFARDADDRERFEPVVAGPENDPLSIVKQVNAGSKLVSARTVGRAPIGWESEPIPFQRPRQRALRSGRAGSSARLYLGEPGASSVIELSARIAGEWGNDITVSVRPAGPARYEMTIWCPGARFENARQIALGACLVALTANALRPGPVGALQARAAGIRASVTRDHAYSSGDELQCIRSN